ncbi:MAG: DUF885 domain-containing protein [Bryobacteraceae bacterium]
MKHFAFLAAAVLLLAGCGRREVRPQDFFSMTGEFVRTTLALSPVSATSAGYHSHQGVVLDEKLDDWTPAGVEARRRHWRSWRDRLNRIEESKLGPEERADLGLMKNLCEAGLFDLDTEQGWKFNPTLYVELIGNALFTPYAVDYAPAAERWRHIVARLEAVPALLDAARANLESSNAVWTQTAIEENDGTIGLIEKELAPKVPAELSHRFRAAASRATGSMRAFNAHLKTLKDSGPEGWRLGPEKYERKFRIVFGGLTSPEQLLKQAEQDLVMLRREMFKTASPLHGKYFPRHRDPVDLNLIVGEVLGRVSEKHPRPETYFQEAQKSLDEVREFLRAHGDQIVPLPPNDNLKIIETPPFMRGIYAVGGFNPAPPLQPELGAFYWLTPIPPDWPKERVESKLREYNDYGLRLLTLHEAIPGHWLQFEYAAQVQPAPRRVLRSLFGDGAYVEGWAVYATDLMVREGYLGGDPELRLVHYKQLLRAVANTILDIGLHTRNMTDQEALDLMIQRTFQEREEAEAKLRRAKLSSCQLPSYWAGFLAWKRLRAAAEAKEAASFRPGEFHRRALLEGALPMPVLAERLGLNLNEAAAAAR